MLGELDIVLWDYNVETLVCIINFDKLKNLKIVLVNIICECERTNINHIYIWILNRENTSYLRVFLLLQLLYCKSLKLREGKGIYMNFHSLCSLNLSPFHLEFLLHFAPDLHRFALKLSHSHPCRFLELIQSVTSLDNGSFFHEISQVSICLKCFKSSVVFLNMNCCQNWAHRTLELVFGIHNWIPNLFFVNDA